MPHQKLCAPCIFAGLPLIFPEYQQTDCQSRKQSVVGSQETKHAKVFQRTPSKSPSQKEFLFVYMKTHHYQLDCVEVVHDNPSSHSLQSQKKPVYQATPMSIHDLIFKQLSQIFTSTGGLEDLYSNSHIILLFFIANQQKG